MGNRLSSLQDTLSAASEALETTRSLVTETQEKIDETTAQLDAKRQTLSGRMRSSYKSGADSTLDLILGSTSVEELVNRIYYLDKVNDSDAAAIDEVRALTQQLEQQKSDLESQQSEQETQADEAQQNLDSYQSEVDRAQSYYNSLDSQVQEALAKEAAEQAAQQTTTSGVAAAVTTVENTNSAQSNGGVASTGNATNSGSAPSQSETESPSSPSTPSTPSGSSTTGGSSSGSDSPTSSKGSAHPGIVSNAAQFLGYPYKSYWQGVNYGPDADGFDCCGLCATAYHLAGYSLPYATSVGGLISYVKGRGNWKSCNLSNYQDVLAVGDLIFCSTGHVAIYAGGSTMIHAPVPGRYVCYANVYACIGGGFGG